MTHSRLSCNNWLTLRPIIHLLPPWVDGHRVPLALERTYVGSREWLQHVILLGALPTGGGGAIGIYYI